jgi:hypothetical protein
MNSIDFIPFFRGCGSGNIILYFLVDFHGNEDVDMVPPLMFLLYFQPTLHPSSFLVEENVLVYVLDLQLYWLERE